MKKKIAALILCAMMSLAFISPGVKAPAPKKCKPSGASVHCFVPGPRQQVTKVMPGTPMAPTPPGDWNVPW